MMKTPKHVPWKSMLAATVVLSSCTGGDQIAGSGGGQTFSPFGVTESDICAELQVVRTKDISRDREIYDDIAYAALFNNSYRGSVDGGTVTVNGSTITRHYFSAGMFYQSTSSDGSSKPDTVPYRHDGGYYVFSVSGSAGFAAYTDSVASPREDLSIIYPTAYDTISKATGCTVKWNGVSSDAARVTIGDTVSTVGHQGFGRTTSDNGSLVISPGDLAGLQTGPVTVMITRGNYTVAHASGDRKILLTAETLVTVHAWLEP
jgi:hypothetical protein